LKNGIVRSVDPNNEKRPCRVLSYFALR